MAEHINFKRKRTGRVVRVEADSQAAKRMDGLNQVWERVDDDAQTVEEAALPTVGPGDLPAANTENDPDNGASEPPAKSDKKDVWVEHAVSQGMARDEAEAVTKKDLVAKYGG